MNNLVLKLKEKMNQEGLSIYSLERNAGLKPNAVHNIISGRSKNPSIGVLQTIAKTLNCSVSELIGEKLTGTLPAVEFRGTAETVLDNELYIKCLEYFSTLLKKNKCWLSRAQILDSVEEIYLYSQKQGLEKVDTHFAKWFFEKIKK